MTTLQVFYNSPVSERHLMSFSRNMANSYVMPGILRTLNDMQSDEYKDFVIATVLEHTGYTFEQVSKKTRKREMTFARQLIMYCLKKKTKLTLKSIGKVFGFDHTTVKYGVKQVIDLMDAYPETRLEIEGLLKNIR
jgi:chromosomal replication initiation ATPase DnaA